MTNATKPPEASTQSKGRTEALTPTEPDRLLGWSEVKRLTQLSRTSVWRACRDGCFPKPRTISPNRVAWVAREISEWIRSRPVSKAFAVEEARK